MQNSTQISPLVAQVGMNTDSILSQLRPGQLTFANNAILTNFDGNTVTYQNDNSNILCTDLSTIKPNYHVIGVKNIVEQKRTVLFMTDNNGNSEIGIRINDTCQYTTLINSPCLNFNIHYPIHKVAVKVTNCNTQIYWTDNFNPLRWLDFDDLPFKEVPNPNNENQPIKTNIVDCNKLLIFPKFSVPKVTPIRMEVGGLLVEGTYQFVVQYANSRGEGYTSYFNPSNPMGIFDNRTTTDFNLPTTQAITVLINGLDKTGLYDYFNLTVIETVNQITSAKLVGTFAITKDTFIYTYTGNTKTDIAVSIDEIFSRFPYYDTADDVAVSDNTIQWANLTTRQKWNLQPVASNIKLYWESWKIPYNEFESYNNPINNGQYRSYLRDEVYAFEIALALTNGRITESFHIPGRTANANDLQLINNKDSRSATNNPCEETTPKPRWEVYNTATKIDFTDEYKTSGSTDCYKGSYEYGEFAYHQSSLNYPNNKDIWGELSNTPIRHHKFPDVVISPIHDSARGVINYEHSIYPIGVRIDANTLYAALEQNLTKDQLSEVQGFMILRSNRSDNNKSVIAKGLFHNVGKYTRDNQTYYYPNYPFNDLRKDPFILNSKPTDHSGSNDNIQLEGFNTDDSKRRYTFYSPNTTFAHPFGIDTGYIKLDTIEQGVTNSHFVKVKDNAEYKFLTKDAIRVAFAMGISSIAKFEISAGFPSGVKASPGIDMSNAVPATLAALELLKNVTPAENYGWNFNSVGNYSDSIPIPNDGNKIRAIEDGRYINSGFPAVSGDTINNFQRESSLYIRTTDTLPYTHEAGGNIDNSRYLADCSSNPVDVTNRNISAYYGAVKRDFPDQYGRMYSYETISTGYYSSLYDENGNRQKFTTIFGGDTFINRFGLKKKVPFFIDNTVGRSQQTDINLDDLGNIAFPNYYYSTKPRDITFDLGSLDTEINAIVDPGFWNILFNIVSGGVRPIASALIILTRVMGVYIDSLGTANVNLHCSAQKTLNEVGRVYLFAYGIPYFFAESEVNVDYRQATNDKEGNFYPNVGQGIPDDWMQESNVSIINDNTYTYNKTYSKQNLEAYFSHLREDFDPKKLCLTNFPNRVFYSEKSTLEETKNNWLIYRPISYFDFPKNYGSLVAIDGLEDRKMLVRFENKSLLYNVYQTSDTSSGTLFMGNPTFYSQPPLDFAETDTGYNGSQNKFILRTEAGHVTVDAARGQIFIYKGNTVDEVSSKGLSKWFTQNLEFKIKNYFPDVNTDNHFRNFGITGVYDSFNGRILITKRDYIPLIDNIKYDSDTGIFYYNNKPIDVDDDNYFCDISWTLSYSLDAQAWVSFHSYIPNYYIPDVSRFDTGILRGIYRHAPNTSFQNFYGKVSPYILEYPRYTITEEILGSVSDSTTILKYTTQDVYFEVETGVYFNKAIIYNYNQCTGLLNLVFKPENNLRAYFNYPIFNANSKDILVTKKDGFFNFNTYWDIVVDKSLPFFNRPCSIPSLDKIFDTNLDYTIRSHKKARIRSRESKIRLIQDKTDEYKFLSKFVIPYGTTSIV